MRSNWGGGGDGRVVILRCRLYGALQPRGWYSRGKGYADEASTIADKDHEDEADVVMHHPFTVAIGPSDCFPDRTNNQGAGATRASAVAIIVGMAGLADI